MILPFRSKNPPEHFPIITIILIVLNVLLYFLTSYQSYFLQIDDKPLKMLSVSHNNLSLWRLSTSMFIHADLSHIIGNMLFLWIFGAATEGRLRPIRYIILYIAAGWTGGLLSDIVNTTFPHPSLRSIDPKDIPSLGASGAIMGVAGAYLYMFPHSFISVLYGFRFHWGVSDWRAWWVVCLYIGIDLVFGVLFRISDGVGHFAHLGGFGTGLLAVLVLRARRDTSEVSEAQALLAESHKDYTMLSYPELDAILRHPTEKIEIVLAFLEKGKGSPDPLRKTRTEEIFGQYQNKLFSDADPERLAALVLSWHEPLQPVYYLRLGSRLEAIYSNNTALSIYRKIYDTALVTRENETALFRTAQIHEKAFGNTQYALSTYHEILRLFPYGDLAMDARHNIKRLGG